ncbi:MAG: Bax inhibitor-1/YccA family protein [Bacteroidales bacterium]|nr:Bax inhibitor-1/YccA family protein [Bacteroidales bacterium]
MFEKSSNPALKNAFSQVRSFSREEGAMTLNGTMNKTIILFLVVIASAAVTWKLILSSPGMAMGLIITGAIGGLIMSLVTIFKKEYSKITSLIYAVFQGLFLGGISLFASTAFAEKAPGIVTNAILLTLGVFLVMLFIYRQGIIKPTQKFMTGLFAATGAIALVYLLSMVLGMFGVQIPLIHGSGTIGIIFSVVVVVIAALNLIMDFKMIEDGVAAQAPKYMEWYGAFGLMVTLIWLYLEILRLLMKLASRD